METNICGYTKTEDLANTITHGIGAILSVIAVAVLFYKAWELGSLLHFASYTVYGVSLIAIFCASTLYHHVQTCELKLKLQKVDLVCIYLYIAGCYTPFMLINMKGAWGYGILLAVWSLAACGSYYKLFTKKPNTFISLASYLLIAFFVVIAWGPLVASIPANGLLALQIGGLFYSLGVIFFLLDRMSYNHAIWHVFVLAGSLSHYVALHLCA